MQSVAQIHLTRYHKAEAPESVMDSLAVEEPMELQLLFEKNGATTNQSVSVTMRTPGQDEELAAGFLFTEGILQHPDQIDQINLEGAGINTILIRLSKGASPILSKADRNFYTTSSCGVCGKSSIDAIKTVSAFSNLVDSLQVKSEVLRKLPESLLQQQAVFNSTGGLHASALFHPEGEFITLREDVGRHNALDKLIGNAFLQNNLPLSNHILLLSGRASFELVQKAAMAGIRVIAAIGAPSSLAVSLAEDEGITLLGFLREDRFNIYTHQQRICL